MPALLQHGTYIWVPLVGAVVWFGTLLVMLTTYLAQGRPHYVSQGGNIAYISDVGADVLKPLFVAGCTITAVSFFLSLLIARRLRHSDCLAAPDIRRRERVFSCLAILGSCIGGLGLLLLSIFDTKRHWSLHHVFLQMFIVGVGLSAIFEYWSISHEARTAKLAWVMKSTIAAFLIMLAVAFAVAVYEAHDAGAILEWVVAFGYAFYLLTFFLDLRCGAARAKERLVDMEQRGQPICAVKRGFECDTWSDKWGSDTNIYPDAYSHIRINDPPHASRLDQGGTYASEGGVSFPQPTYWSASGRAAKA